MDWGNAFGSSPRKMQLVDWMIVDDGEIGGGHGASPKTSRFSGNLNKKMQFSGGIFRPHLEPFIGLKLGKRTYNNGGGNVKDASITTTSFKKTKSIHVPRCVVEGCSVDLSTAKEYHRKHRVCGSHSKSPKVIVGGLEPRFCQQCSRFHDLSEFDEAKRSCRRRLSDHNARRRKPQQEFTSTTRQSMLSYYGERQQLSFLLNNSPLTHSRDSVDTTWNTTCNSNFTLAKGYPLKFTGEGRISEELMHMPGAKLPHVIDTQGSKISPVCSGLDPAPEYHSALSLLSYNNCGPCAPETMPAAVHEIGSCAAQPMVHTTQEGGPLSSPEFWLAGDQTTSPRHFQLLEAAELYSQIMN